MAQTELKFIKHETHQVAEASAWNYNSRSEKLNFIQIYSDFKFMIMLDIGYRLWHSCRKILNANKVNLKQSKSDTKKTLRKTSFVDKIIRIELQI